MLQIALFDYATLDTDTRAFVQEQEAELDCVLKRTSEEIGNILIKVKDRLPHGQYMPWLASRSMSQKTAWRCMQAAQGKEIKKSVKMTDLSSIESDEIPAIREAKQEIASYQPAQRPALPVTYQTPEPTYTPPVVQPVIISREEEDVQREIRREQAKERIAQLKERGVELPTGKYSCLVVDPPWQMQKIERDVRPNQVEFDYPTMNEEELKAFPLPDFSADDCHLYLWTTQKHLPLALRIVMISLSESVILSSTT